MPDSNDGGGGDTDPYSYDSGGGPGSGGPPGGPGDTPPGGGTSGGGNSGQTGGSAGSQSCTVDISVPGTFIGDFHFFSHKRMHALRSALFTRLRLYKQENSNPE